MTERQSKRQPVPFDEALRRIVKAPPKTKKKSGLKKTPRRKKAAAKR